MRRLAKVRAPAKLILSGEHAVVYGKPALAMATQQYTECKAVVTTDKQSIESTVSFQLPYFNYTDTVDTRSLHTLHQHLSSAYAHFLAGKQGIREVLKQPTELIHFTVASIIKQHNVPFQSLDIQSHSTVPIGCGMGSSAALVMSTLWATAQALNVSLSDTDCLSLGIQAENLQHGYSSGLDIQLTWQGGCLYFKEGQSTTRTLPRMPLYVIHTGKPLSTTGECVVQARSHFLRSSIATDFEAVTNHLDVAFMRNDYDAIQLGIRENHRLLCRIAVVPETVSKLIQDLEYAGAAAKICGAGAVIGECAGMVLVVSESIERIQPVVEKFGFSVEQIQGDTDGTQCI